MDSPRGAVYQFWAWGHCDIGPRLWDWGFCENWSPGVLSSQWILNSYVYPLSLQMPLVKSCRSLFPLIVLFPLAYTQALEDRTIKLLIGFVKHPMYVSLTVDTKSMFFHECLSNPIRLFFLLIRFCCIFISFLFSFLTCNTCHANASFLRTIANMQI